MIEEDNVYNVYITRYMENPENDIYHDVTKILGILIHQT